MERKLLIVAACTFALASSGPAMAQTDENTRPIEKRLDVDRSFRIDLANDCAYNARVHGEIEPKQTLGSPDGLEADLVVNADLQCADQAALLLTERITSDGSMSRAQLERTLEARSTLSGAGRDACRYTPDFNLSNAGLYLRAVSYRCPARE